MGAYESEEEIGFSGLSNRRPRFVIFIAFPHFLEKNPGLFLTKWKKNNIF